MDTPKLKHHEHIAAIKHCPPGHFAPMARPAFRWLHLPLREEDFLPLHLQKEPPARMLDDSDKMCIGHGLSMFDTLAQATSRFRALLSRQNTAIKRRIFVEDKGEYVGELRLEEVDGLSDAANPDGHFTFFAFESSDLAKKQMRFVRIFDDHGTPAQ